MTTNTAARRVLLSARRKYEADGYVVSLDEQLPKPYDGFVANAVARRNDEFVIVEVRPAELNSDSRDRLAKLSQILRDDCSWRLDIFTYVPEELPPVPDPDDISRRVQEARQIAGESPDGASQLLWSAIEGALLWLANKRDVAPARLMPALNLIQQVTMEGVLSDNQAAELKVLARARDAIAHGMRADPPSAGQFDWLCRFALDAVEGKHADLHDMVVWFTARHATPDNAALAYDTSDEQYVWLGSGPHYAEQVLRQQFENALEADIAEAVRTIEKDGTEWARLDQL